MRSGQSWLCKCLEEEPSRRRNSTGKGPGAGVGEKTGRPAWLKSWMEQIEGGGESQGARELEETRKGSGFHSHVHVPTDGGRLALTHICIPRAIN